MLSTSIPLLAAPPRASLVIHSEMRSVSDRKHDCCRPIFGTCSCLSDTRRRSRIYSPSTKETIISPFSRGAHPFFIPLATLFPLRDREENPDMMWTMIPVPVVLGVVSKILCGWFVLQRLPVHNTRNSQFISVIK